MKLKAGKERKVELSGNKIQVIISGRECNTVSNFKKNGLRNVPDDENGFIYE